MRCCEWFIDYFGEKSLLKHIYEITPKCKNNQFYCLDNIERWRSQGSAEKLAVAEIEWCRGGRRVMEVMEVGAV